MIPVALRDRAELPRAKDLPVSDGVPMESEQDAINARVYLCEALKVWCRQRGIAAFVGSNSFVYYSPKIDPVGPDLYVVNGGLQEKQEMWVAWEEGGSLPTLVIEFLSESTEAVDRGRKLELYRDVFRCTDYFLCERDIGVVEGYRLRNGVYVRTRSDRHRRLRCGSLPLLVGFQDEWLRFFTVDGKVVPTDAERAETEHERAEAEHELAQAERRRAAAAIEELQALRRQLGMNGTPD